MNFEQIETQRLLLKRLNPEDFERIFKENSEDQIKTILGLRTEQEFAKEKRKSEEGYASYDRSFAYFQLVDKASDTIISGAGFHNWSQLHQRAELGYGLTLEHFKNKGLMSEALDDILNYGFDQLALNRIEAFVSPSNVPSLKLLAKYGFAQEGVLRQHYLTSEGFEDSLVFSKLKEHLFHSYTRMDMK